LQKVSGLQGSGLLQWIDRTSPYKKEKGMSEGGAVQVREEARKGYFDRFAQRCAEVASKAPFFTFCIALVVVWIPTILFTDFDTWQLLINTPLSSRKLRASEAAFSNREVFSSRRP
jgi:hypothetical protein